MDKKKLRNDLILVGSLLVLAITAFILVLTIGKKKASIAKVYVKDQIVQTINLETAGDSTFEIDGANGKLIIETHDGAIRVHESNCPHQDCVNQGYVKDTNHPIICAYNQVYIIIEGEPSYDVEI